MKGGDILKKYFARINKKKGIVIASVVTAITTVATVVGATPADPIVEALTFEFDMSGLGSAIAAALSSLWTVGRFPVALIVAAAILSFAISIFQRFRAGGRRA